MNWYVKLFDVCIHREYTFIFIQIILAAISGDNGDIKQQNMLLTSMTPVGTVDWMGRDNVLEKVLHLKLLK